MSEQQAAGWKPMATAPIDGSIFLAAYGATHGPSVGPMRWDASGRRFLSYAMLTESDSATHWRPMLPGPASEPPADPVGCAEQELGRYVYRIIGALMDVEDGAPGAAELAYLSRLVIDVEEYGADHMLTEADLRHDPSRWLDPMKDRKAP